jgi:hypothetical protein
VTNLTGLVTSVTGSVPDESDSGWCPNSVLTVIVEVEAGYLAGARGGVLFLGT